MLENDIICGVLVYFRLDLNALFSKTSMRRIPPEREKTWEIGWVLIGKRLVRRIPLTGPIIGKSAGILMGGVVCVGCYF